MLRRAAPRALAALHHHGATWQHPPLSAAHASWREAPLLESPRFHGVRVPRRRKPCLLWSECTGERFTGTLALFTLPLGAVWDQRVHGKQQQVLHFYRRCRAWGLSQSEQPPRAPGVGQRLLRWSVESMRTRAIIGNSYPEEGFHWNATDSPKATVSYFHVKTTTRFKVDDVSPSTSQWSFLSTVECRTNSIMPPILVESRDLILLSNSKSFFSHTVSRQYLLAIFVVIIIVTYVWMFCLLTVSIDGCIGFFRGVFFLPKSGYWTYRHEIELQINQVSRLKARIEAGTDLDVTHQCHVQEKERRKNCLILIKAK